MSNNYKIHLEQFERMISRINVYGPRSNGHKLGLIRKLQCYKAKSEIKSNLMSRLDKECLFFIQTYGG